MPLEVPGLWFMSWYDVSVGPNLAMYNHVRKNASPEIAEQQWAVIAPVTHRAFTRATKNTVVGERSMGDARLDYEEILWGGQNPIRVNQWWSLVKWNTISTHGSRPTALVGRVRMSKDASDSTGSPLTRYVPVLLRITLGLAFLSAVADRFGLWGPPGARNVAWGDFESFSRYTATLNPWAPQLLIPVLAWTATLAEIVIGLALLAGIRTRLVALLAGILLSSFAFGMTLGTGVKTALDASVPTAAAAAFALAVLVPRR